MKQRLGVALSVLFLVGACLMMGMVGTWTGPMVMRQEMARAGSGGFSKLVGASTPTEGVNGHPPSQMTVLDTSLGTDASSYDAYLDPWLPLAVALSSGIIVIRISCLRHDASEEN